MPIGAFAFEAFDFLEHGGHALGVVGLESEFHQQLADREIVRIGIARQAAEFFRLCQIANLGRELGQSAIEHDPFRPGIGGDVVAQRREHLGRVLLVAPDEARGIGQTEPDLVAEFGLGVGDQLGHAVPMLLPLGEAHQGRPELDLVGRFVARREQNLLGFLGMILVHRHVGPHDLRVGRFGTVAAQFVQGRNEFLTVFLAGRLCGPFGDDHPRDPFLAGLFQTLELADLAIFVERFVILALRQKRAGQRQPGGRPGGIDVRGLAIFGQLEFGVAELVVGSGQLIMGFLEQLGRVLDRRNHQLEALRRFLPVTVAVVNLGLKHFDERLNLRFVGKGLQLFDGFFRIGQFVGVNPDAPQLPEESRGFWVGFFGSFFQRGDRLLAIGALLEPRQDDVP